MSSDSLRRSANTIYCFHLDPPPSYYDSIADEPPIYDSTDNLASVPPPYQQQELPPAYDYVPTIANEPGSMTIPGIDLDDTSSFRQVGGAKKNKKAQKAADQAKWANGGDEDNKEGAAGEENGGGDAGGSNNGDGGAGGDGGGRGDDWNDWDTGKGKKKGKKSKEEEKEKQEEEEKKKKEEEEAANGGNALSWADEANADDDWGGFTTAATKKDKKGKKGKVGHTCP